MRSNASSTTKKRPPPNPKKTKKTQNIAVKGTNGPTRPKTKKKVVPLSAASLRSPRDSRSDDSAAHSTTRTATRPSPEGPFTRQSLVSFPTAFVPGSRTPSVVYRTPDSTTNRRRPYSSFTSNRGASFSSFKERKSSKMRLKYAQQIETAAALRIQTWFRRVRKGNRFPRITVTGDGTFLRELRVVHARETQAEEVMRLWAMSVLHRCIRRARRYLLEKPKPPGDTHLTVVQAFLRSKMSNQHAMSRTYWKARRAVNTIEAFWLNSRTYKNWKENPLLSDEIRLLLRAERVHRRYWYLVRLQYIIDTHQQFCNHPLSGDTPLVTRRIDWENEIRNSVIAYEVNPQKTSGVGKTRTTLTHLTADERKLLLETQEEERPVTEVDRIPSKVRETNSEAEPGHHIHEFKVIRSLMTYLTGGLVTKEDEQALQLRLTDGALHQYVQRAVLTHPHQLSEALLFGVSTEQNSGLAKALLRLNATACRSDDGLFARPPLLIMGDWNETAIASVLRPPCGGESRIKAIDSHQAARRDTILMEQSRIFTSSSAYLGHSWREFLLSCCSAEKRKSMNPNRSSPSALPVSLGKVDAHHSAGISQLPGDGRKKHGLPLLRSDGSRAPTKLLLQDLIPKPNKVAVNVQTTLPGEDAPSAERWWKLPVDVPFPFDFVIFVDRLERLLLREQFSRGRVEQFQTEQFDSIRMLFHL